MEGVWARVHGMSDGCECDESERKKMRRMGSTPPRLTLFIEGSTESSRCGFLLRTTNGSTPRSSREDYDGFFTNRPSVATEI
jgi:hypothetical protein